MKYFTLLVFCIGLTLQGYSQNVIDLTLRYSVALSRYEVYARPTFTQAQYNWGSSQITVVTPAASVSDSPFTVTSFFGGGWDDASQVYAPLSAVGSDFHGISSQGKKVDLVANQELLLFAFTLPLSTCVSGLRLFVNGTDPNSGAAGMRGGDFTNVIYTTSVSQSQINVFQMVYANSGTNCTACNLVAPSLSK
jgi:hypothetical protein